MDRSTELFSICKLLSTSEDGEDLPKREFIPLSPYVQLCIKTAKEVEQNESLVGRIAKLATRKAFSNDPTSPLTESIGMFEKSSAVIRTELAQLKSKHHLQGRQGSGSGKQQERHYALIVEHIQKQLTAQVDVFQRSLQEYTGNVQAREKRVNKYGTTSLPVGGFDGGLAPSAVIPGLARSSPAPQFAMFGGSPHTVSPSGSSMFAPDNTALRHRSNAAGVSGSSSGGVYATGIGHGTGGSAPPSSSGSGSSGSTEDSSSKYYKAGIKTPYGTNSAGGGHQTQTMQQQTIRNNKQNVYRLQQSEQIETSIARMGELFSKMATLVMEQSEKIGNIEDDVESGMDNTLQAEKHVHTAYEITKGNRSVIVKIFGILVVCIILFLYTT